jgi:hypothetical protein
MLFVGGGTGCDSCEVECAAGGAQVSALGGEVASIELCDESGCITRLVSGSPTTSLIWPGGEGNGLPFGVGTRTYRVRVFGAGGEVLAEGSKRANLDADGSCDCPSRLDIAFQGGELTLSGPS